MANGTKGSWSRLVERRSQYTIAQGVPHKTATAFQGAVVQSLQPHKARVHTITDDNGREFSEHVGMAHDLRAAISCAHPFASWERGVNENTNGLLRQCFPKARDLTLVSQTELATVLDTRSIIDQEKHWAVARPMKYSSTRPHH